MQSFFLLLLIILLFNSNATEVIYCEVAASSVAIGHIFNAKLLIRLCINNAHLTSLVSKLSKPPFIC